MINVSEWRKRQIALDQKAENAKELGLDYAPVAIVTSDSGANVTHSWWHEPALRVGTKLYTTPPQRTWIGLTEQDIPSGEDPIFSHQYFLVGMLYANKVLKEKNT